MWLKAFTGCNLCDTEMLSTLPPLFYSGHSTRITGLSSATLRDLGFQTYANPLSYQVSIDAQSLTKSSTSTELIVKWWDKGSSVRNGRHMEWRTTVCMREQKLELNESRNTVSNEND